jgi:hypothetical protein
MVGYFDVECFYLKCWQCATFGAIQAGNVFQLVPDMSSAKAAGRDVINVC